MGKWLTPGVRDGLIVSAIGGTITLIGLAFQEFAPGKSIPEKFAWLWSYLATFVSTIQNWLVANVEWRRWEVIALLLLFLATLVGAFWGGWRLARNSQSDSDENITPFQAAKAWRLTDKKPLDTVSEADKERYALRLQVLGAFWRLKSGQRINASSFARTLERNENLIEHQLELLAAEGLVIETVDPLSGKSYHLSPEGRAYCATLHSPEMDRTH